MNKRTTGAVYELKAAEYLEGLGYQIVARNYRSRVGEIDLIAKDGQYLVFVEVKYRSGRMSGYGYEAVDYRKQQRIIRTAQWYLMEKKIAPDQPCRFDVLSFLGEHATLIRDAFQC